MRCGAPPLRRRNLTLAERWTKLSPRNIPMAFRKSRTTMPPDPKLPTVEEMRTMAHMNCIHSCHDDDPPQERCEKCESVHDALDARAARVRELENIKEHGEVPIQAAIQAISDALRERDEARSESDAAIRDRNVMDDERNEAELDRIQLKAENARLREALDTIAKNPGMDDLRGFALAAVFVSGRELTEAEKQHALTLRDGREGKG